MGIWARAEKTNKNGERHKHMPLPVRSNRQLKDGRFFYLCLCFTTVSELRRTVVVKREF